MADRERKRIQAKREKRVKECGGSNIKVSRR